MNSSDKYIPQLVFAFGVLLLGAAVLIFLSDVNSTVPVSLKNMAEPKVELSGTDNLKAAERPWLAKAGEKEVASSSNFTSPASLTTSLSTAHLKNVGLSIRLPEALAYGETKARGMNVLVGTGKSGKPQFFLFSSKGKMKLDKTKAMLEEQFHDDHLRGREVTSLNSKGGLGAMTVVKGVMGDSEEFQAYAFQNGKAGNSHILLLVEPELSKQPARVRQIVDSVTTAR